LSFNFLEKDSENQKRVVKRKTNKVLNEGSDRTTNEPTEINPTVNNANNGLIKN
jgi:hypothetical protein